MERIAVVGGSGYVGSAIARRLSRTYRVRILDMNDVPNDLAGIAEFEKCNVMDYKNVKNGLKNVDLVIHTAIVQIPLINEKRRLAYEVNFLGAQNVCRAVDETPTLKGMILTGTWHIFGEQRLDGTIDESFGFRPDMVENRARLYVLSKIAQEVIVRYYDEMSSKIFGIIRMGTVLGRGMPEKTAANIFISKGLKGESLTPFKHSMYRPMLYIDIGDVCEAYARYAAKILEGRTSKEENSLAHVINLCYPEPITILDLANTIRETIIELTEGKVQPKIDVVDTGEPTLYEAGDKHKMKVDASRVSKFLGIEKLTDPRLSVRRLIEDAIAAH